jgi:hypothetical protein
VIDVKCDKWSKILSDKVRSMLCGILMYRRIERKVKSRLKKHIDYSVRFKMMKFCRNSGSLMM